MKYDKHILLSTTLSTYSYQFANM